MLDAGKVVGVISIGDVVKNIIRDLEHNESDLMGYIIAHGPGGLTDEQSTVAPVTDFVVGLVRLRTARRGGLATASFPLLRNMFWFRRPLRPALLSSHESGGRDRPLHRRLMP